MNDGEVLKGTVVASDPKSPQPAVPMGGLYLLTDDGAMLKLIEAGPQTQASVEHLHGQSRATFEPYLGKQVAVQGHRMGSTLWSAMIVDDREEAPGT